LDEEERKMRVLDQTHGEGYSLYHGDCVEVLPELPEASVDLALYSPPFNSLYVYSPSERDVGNVRTDAEFFEHYGYVVEEVLGAEAGPVVRGSLDGPALNHRHARGVGPAGLHGRAGSGAHGGWLRLPRAGDGG
jgi:hypothetical protein